MYYFISSHYLPTQYFQILAEINQTECLNETDSFSPFTKTKIKLVADYESDHSTIIMRRTSSRSSSSSSNSSAPDTLSSANITDQQAQELNISPSISRLGECKENIDQRARVCYFATIVIVVIAYYVSFSTVIK